MPRIFVSANYDRSRFADVLFVASVPYLLALLLGLTAGRSLGNLLIAEGLVFSTLLASFASVYGWKYAIAIATTALAVTTAAALWMSGELPTLLAVGLLVILAVLIFRLVSGGPPDGWDAPQNTEAVLARIRDRGDMED